MFTVHNGSCVLVLCAICNVFSHAYAYMQYGNEWIRWECSQKLTKMKPDRLCLVRIHWNVCTNCELKPTGMSQSQLKMFHQSDSRCINAFESCRIAIAPIDQLDSQTLQTTNTYIDVCINVVVNLQVWPQIFRPHTYVIIRNEACISDKREWERVCELKLPAFSLIFTNSFSLRPSNGHEHSHSHLPGRMQNWLNFE